MIIASPYGLHLDIGHSNLSPVPGNAEAILQAHGGRLRHVQLHNNKGGDQDLHLALGSGTMDIPRMVRALKATGYDSTITLEVFSPDRHYLEYSEIFCENSGIQSSFIHK